MSRADWPTVVPVVEGKDVVRTGGLTAAPSGAAASRAQEEPLQGSSRRMRRKVWLDSNLGLTCHGCWTHEWIGPNWTDDFRVRLEAFERRHADCEEMEL